MSQQTDILLIDASAAATLCGLSRSAWYKLVSGGKAPASVKLGRAARWNRDELERWIVAGCPARAKWKTMDCKK